MKKNTKLPTDNNITKKDLDQSLDKQTTWLKKAFDKQNKEIKNKFDEHTRLFNKKLDKHTRFFEKKLDDHTRLFDKKIDSQSLSFSEVINNLVTEIGIKFAQQDKRFDQIDQRFNQLGKDLLESNLKIISELKITREEQTVMFHQLKKHEDRLTTLEENYQLIS